jgi:methionyl-tRNA synthetase
MATSYGSDLNFSQQSLVMMHNSELADILGNLVHRGLTLCLKYCDGAIPDSTHDSSFPLPFDFEVLDREIRNDLTSSSLSVATFRAMDAVRATNKFLTTAEPWKMKNESDIPRRIAVVRTTLEAIYIFSHYLAAIIPNAAGEIFKRLNTQPRPTNTLRSDFYNLVPGTKISLGNILFTKIEEPNDPPAATPIQKQTTTSKKENKSESKKEKPTEVQAKKPKEADVTNEVKEKKEKKSKASQNEETEIEQHDFTKIELRVGQIVNVWNHESAERFLFSAYISDFILDSFAKRLILVKGNLVELHLAFGSTTL